MTDSIREYNELELDSQEVSTTSCAENVILPDAQQELAVQNTGHFFEGVEKLLEIWFTPIENEDADLRNIPRSIWERLLKLVKCEIISFSQNDTIDAYVLSESSMFVSKRRLILKTCGTTTPLECLKGMMGLAKKIGFSEVTDMFYSRKNFTRPELQHFPHRGFCEEVEFLDSIFPDGRSYCLGSLNRECWYLYTFSKFNKQNELDASTLTEADSGNFSTLESDVEEEAGVMNCETCSEPDQTVEVLMQDLDEDVMKLFFKENCSTAEEATKKSGIDKLIPHMKIDDYLFEPCGYSMNGIGRDGEYMTIHITPEKDFSYVSFESNIAPSNYKALVKRVVKTFKPAKFIVTIFANKTSAGFGTIKNLNFDFSQPGTWNRTDIQCCKFPSYNLLYAQYTGVS